MLGEHSQKCSRPLCFCRWSLVFPDLDDSGFPLHPLCQVSCVKSILLHLAVIVLRNMVLLTLTRGRKDTETVDEVVEVVEEVDSNKASTIKQMQDIVLKVQVGIFGLHILMYIEGKSWLDGEPAGERPECFQLQRHPLSHLGWLCHHRHRYRCHVFSASQVLPSRRGFIRLRKYNNFVPDLEKSDCLTFSVQDHFPHVGSELEIIRFLFHFLFHFIPGSYSLCGG